MAFIGFLHISLVFLVYQVHSEEFEPELRAVDSTIVLGYCFGVDYIVLYKCGPEGDQLLGNSSDDNRPITPLADLQGRVHINNNNHLLGLQIHQLRLSDSGIYRRECWKNQTRVSHRSQQLFVCGEELEAKKVIPDEQDGQTQLLCDGTGGTSVRWYYDIEQASGLQLFLDTSVSPEPLVDELQGVVKVKQNGTSLLVKNTLLKQKQQFYCLVANGEECLSFQNMHQTVHSERRTVFASVGDKVELDCPFQSNTQQWETPEGRINSSSVRNNQMYLESEKPGQYSLVIPVVSDEHGGEYSCITATLDLQYSLALCPRKKTTEKAFTEGGTILLECDVGRDVPKTVLWFRQESAGGHRLILDSSDETAEVPEDLRGRTSLSMGDFSLTLSDAHQKDGGFYWCVALGGAESLESDYDYIDDYDDEYEDEGQFWYETPKCFLKQENRMLLTGKTSGISELAIAAIVIVILATGLVVAVVAIRKAKFSQKQKEARRTNKDITIRVDPECMEKLNPV